mgnify:CR=1 FL=1
MLFRSVGVMNAGPFSARLLTNAPLPAWLKEPENVKAAARAAAAHCASKGVDIAKLALQFCIQHPDIATTVPGTANPDNMAKMLKWIDEPVDWELIGEVQKVLEPTKNILWPVGRPENSEDLNAGL